MFSDLIVAQEWIVAQDTQSSLIQDDIERIEAETGQNVNLLDADWIKHMRAGVIARLHIRRWRGKTRLDSQDLGMDAEHVQSLAKLMHLGEKMLMPKEIVRRLDNLDSKARTRLGNASYQTYWGQFVPVTAYQGLKDDLAGLEAEYFGLRDEMIANYDLWLAQMRSEYRQVAQMAYRRLAQVSPATVRFQDEEGFVVTFVTNILARIPSREEIYTSFGFDLELLYIPLPSLLAEDVARAQGIQIQTDLDIDRMQAKRKLEREQEWAEEERLRAGVLAARSAAQVQAEMMERMNRDIVDAARQQKEQLVNGFMADIRSQLTGLIFETCRDVLEKLKGKDDLHARTVVQVKNLIVQIEKLNFFEDQDAAQMIQRLRETVVLPSPGDRTLGDIQAQLGAIVTLTRQTLVDLGARPASIRSLGLPDVVTVAGIDMARRTLNLKSETLEPALIMDRGIRWVAADEEVH